MTWIAFIGGWVGISIIVTLAFCWIVDTKPSEIEREN